MHLFQPTLNYLFLLVRLTGPDETSKRSWGLGLVWLLFSLLSLGISLFGPDSFIVDADEVFDEAVDHEDGKDGLE